MSKQKYFALVSSLAGQDPAPVKVIPAGDLYRLKPNSEACPFRPRHDGDFNRKEEYGRKMVVDGQPVMVRHIIFQLNVDSSALESEIRKHINTRKFTLPPRKSVSPTMEPVSTYNFPSCSKRRAETKTLKDAVHKAKVSVGDEVLSTFHRMKQVDHVPNASDAELNNNNVPRSHVSVCTNTDVLEESCELQEAYSEIISLKKQLDALKDLTYIKEELRIIRDSVAEIKKGTTSDSTNNLTTKSSRQKHSRLSELPSNLLTDDEEEVADDEVKVGPGRTVNKADIVRVEKQTYLTARIEELLDVFYGGNPGFFSLSGMSHQPGITLTKIHDSEVHSLNKILQHMKWSYQVEIKETSIRDRIAKYTHSKRKGALGQASKRKENKENMLPSRKKVKTISSDSESDQELTSQELTDTD